jgi:hypothetical protein
MGESNAKRSFSLKSCFVPDDVENVSSGEPDERAFIATNFRKPPPDQNSQHHCCLQSLTLQHYAGYKPSDLRECVEALHQLQLNRKGCTLPATREKYRSPKVGLCSFKSNVVAAAKLTSGVTVTLHCLCANKHICLHFRVQDASSFRLEV